jgi:cytidylate kinase
MIITIDGPAGAGKSTVAKLLAQRLGFFFLDTGAMYRAVALAGLRRGIDWAVAEQLAELAANVQIDLDGDRVLLDGQDVSHAIRSSQVTAVTRYVADSPQVRQLMVALQRRLAAGKNVVTEGRDQGTLVFPRAELKVFLTASPEERARRRLRDLATQGESATFEQVLQAITQRDQQDEQRPVGAMRRAPDAIELCTDGLTIEEVVDRLELLARQRFPKL